MFYCFFQVKNKATMTKEVIKRVLPFSVDCILCSDNTVYVAKNKEVIIFNIATDEEETRTFEHDSSIFRMALSRDKSVLYALLVNGDMLGTTLATDQSFMYFNMYILCMTPAEESCIFVTSFFPSHGIRLIDTGTEKNVQYVHTDLAVFTGLLYVPTHKKIIASAGQLLALWDIDKTDVDVSIKLTELGLIKETMLINEDMFATATITGLTDTPVITLWSTSDLARIRSIRTYFPRIGDRFFVTVIEQRYLVCFIQGFIHVCDTVDQVDVHTYFILKDALGNIAASSDGQVVVYNNTENTVSLEKHQYGLLPPLIRSTMRCGGAPNWCKVELHRTQKAITIDGNPAFQLRPTTIITVESRCSFVIENASTCTGVQTRKRKAQQESDTLKLTVTRVGDVARWTNAIAAVVSMMSLPDDEQLMRTNHNVINWHRFDMFQMTKQRKNHRGLFELVVPRNVIQLIGYYLIKK